MGTKAVPGKSPAAPAAEHGAELAGADSLAKIRDILFGEQARAFDQRFEQFEARMAKETAALRQELERRHAELAQQLQSGLDALGERLTEEARVRGEADADLQQDVESMGRRLEDRLQGDFDTLEGLLDERVAGLTAELSRQHRELSARLSREAEGLGMSKASRSDLAALFASLAESLRDSGDGGSSA